jgi:hypothetical protein
MKEITFGSEEWIEHRRRMRTDPQYEKDYYAQQERERAEREAQYWRSKETRARLLIEKGEAITEMDDLLSRAAEIAKRNGLSREYIRSAREFIAKEADNE